VELFSHLQLPALQCRGLKHERYSKLIHITAHLSLGGVRLCGVHILVIHRRPQFTHWSALAVCKFWSAFYPLVGLQVCTSALCCSP